MKTVAVPLPSPCDIYHPSIGASTASVNGIPVSVFSSLVVIRLWLLSHFPVQVARGVVFSGSGCVLHLSPIVSCWFLLLPPPPALVSVSFVGVCAHCCYCCCRSWYTGRSGRWSPFPSNSGPLLFSLFLGVRWRIRRYYWRYFGPTSYTCILLLAYPHTTHSFIVFCIAN